MQVVTLAREAPTPLSHCPTAPAPIGHGEQALRLEPLLVTLVASLAEAYELDKRERAITRMLLRGRDVHTIAKCLGLNWRMTAWQVQDVFAKTETDSPRSLLHLALRTASARERVDAPVRVMPRWSNVNASVRD